MTAKDHRARAAEYIARRAHETKVDAVLERVVAEESGVLERLKDA